MDMEIRIDEERWAKTVRRANWYIELVPELREIELRARGLETRARESLKEAIYSFFQEQLRAGNLVLGQEVGHWDVERAPIDTLIIHHTSAAPGMTLERLSAIELVRLYAPEYARIAREKGQVGLISSGHVHDGQQVFWPYHWLVRMDGTALRLLHDKEIGWQAGRWEVNCRGVAIALDNDYTAASPTTSVLRSVANIIRSHYSSISPDRIFGHREINPKTSCPSNLFLPSPGHAGWKTELLRLLK